MSGELVRFVTKSFRYRVRKVCACVESPLVCVCGGRGVGFVGMASSLNSEKSPSVCMCGACVCVWWQGRGMSLKSQLAEITKEISKEISKDRPLLNVLYSTI